MDRANTICDDASQASELQHVKYVLWANGYSLQDTTEHPNPDWPGEVPEKVTTGHTSHTSKGPLIASPVYCKNMTFTQYRNLSTKWLPNSIPLKTGNSWLKNRVFTRSCVPAARCTSDKPAVTSPPGSHNT
jgi:hypothetical protein